MDKAPDAYRTISEVADDLDIAQHVLRFWETRFPQIRPLKRGGGRRYYRPDDVELLKGIRHLLYNEGYTIRGVQRILKEQGPKAVQGALHHVPETWSAEAEASSAPFVSPGPALGAAPPLHLDPALPGMIAPIAMPRHASPAMAPDNPHTYPDMRAEPGFPAPREIIPVKTVPQADFSYTPLPDNTPFHQPMIEESVLLLHPGGAPAQVSMFRGGLQARADAVAQRMTASPAPEEAATPETPQETIQLEESIKPEVSSVYRRPRRAQQANLRQALAILEECRSLIHASLSRNSKTES